SDPAQHDDYGKYRIISLDQTVNGSGSFACIFIAISAGAVTPPIDVVPDYQPIEDEFATVMDNKDPEKMGRIKVQHIWQTGDEMTHWLDTSQVYA
ncbi:phage baseplate assembly protein V, partial [Streptomyces turgidiscabies]|uniref:phage baseplate assembly protein V n=1 Tax=Streptomyces turgidiscabies TaxID=85558 RepID=UPI0038F665F0